VDTLPIDLYVFNTIQVKHDLIKYEKNKEEYEIIDNIITFNYQDTLIKDLLITITSPNDEFVDKLSDITIVYSIIDEMIPAFHIDNLMLNKYIPFKYMGHELPPGIYYYSFSNKPFKNKLIGGTSGDNFLINIKTYNIEAKITIYVGTYNKLFI